MAIPITDRIIAQSEGAMSKGRIEQTDAPYAVYSRPCTRFAAGFIGRTNFVEGRVAVDAERMSTSRSLC
jgi:putative spermidine/putrescine transport system ATP-binding protein